MLRTFSGVFSPVVVVGSLLAVVPFVAPGSAAGEEPGSIEEWTARLLAAEARLGADALDLAAIHDSLLVRYLDVPDPESAHRHALESLRIKRLHYPENDVVVGYAWYEVGYTKYAAEDYAAAAEAYRKSLDVLLAGESPDPEDLVWCESDLAEMYRLQGFHGETERYLRSALNRARAVPGGTSFDAVLINNLASLYWDQDRFDEAEPLFRESLAMRLASSETPPLNVAVAHLNLGVILRSQLRFEEAEPELDEALAIARATFPEGDRRLVIFLNGPAGLYSLTGRFAEARALREESLRILDTLEHPPQLQRSGILHRVGEDLLAEDRPGEAATRFQASREIRAELLGPEHGSVGISLAALAECRSRRYGLEDAEVAELVNAALTILETAPVAEEERARALILRARRSRALGEAGAARNDLEAALALAETLRAQRGGGDETRIRFLQEFLDAHHELVAWMVEDGDVEGALRQSERIKARVLQEQLAAARVDLRSGIPADVLAPLEERERSARADVNGIRREIRLLERAETVGDAERARRVELENELDAAIEELRHVTDEIKLHSPTWRELLRGPGEAVTVARVQREILGEDEALLAYQIGGERSFAFSVTADGLAAHELRVPADVAGRFGVPEGPLGSGDLAVLALGDGADDGLLALARPSGTVRGVTGTAALPAESGPLAGRLRALHRVLVPEDLDRRIRGVEQVVLVPDDRLHAVAFEALVVSDDGTWWLDEGPAIRYAHSVATLLSDGGSRKEVEADPVLLTVCDPDFGSGEARVARFRSGETLASLPGTARESEAIVSVFDAGDVRLLRGPDATETNVKELCGGARYLHFATHGLVDRSRSELLASLALAAPRGAGGASGADDGFLHLFEIYELDLAADLTVLSACDTNAGRLLEGEGVFALSRGFLAAGSATVVASLWPVHDESTAELMGGFFRRLAALEEGAGPADHARILRDAKRELRANDGFRDPHFWAPFVLTAR